MPKAKKIDVTVEEIKKLLKSNKLVLGTERTLKELRQGNISKIYISKNIPKKIRAEIMNYSKLSDIGVVNLKYTNEYIGEICKKPFSVSVLGQIKWL